MKNSYEKSKLEIKVTLVYLILLYILRVAYLYFGKHIELINAIITTAKNYFIIFCFGLMAVVFWYVATIVHNYWRLKVKKGKQNRFL